MLDGSYNFGVYIKQNYSGSSYLILGTTHNAVDTDALFVKSGNVGIGNTNPSNPLTLYKNASQGNPSSHTPANASLKIEDNANTMYLDGNSIITTGTAAFTMGNTAAAALIMYTNAVERLRIDSTGRVGINVTPSYANVPLHTKRLGGGDAFNLFEGDSAWVFGEVEISGAKYCQVAGRYGSHSGINVTTAGDVKIGGYDVENPASINRVLEISAASPVGLILNDTRDAHPMYVANEGAVLNFKYNTYNMMTVSPDGNNNIAIIKAKPSTYNSVAILSLYGTNSSTYGGSVVVRSSILSSTDGTAFGANLIFKTNDTSNVEQERMRIDSSGNASIGDGGAGARGARLLLNNTGSQGTPQLMLVDSNDSGKQSEIRFDSGNLIFDYWGGTSRSERMRITSGGRVLIGPNSSSYSSNDAITHLTGNSSNYVAYFHAEAIYAGAWRYARFLSSGNSTLAGEINGSTATSVIYGTTSDYRQKKNIKPLENGLERLSKLKPVKFDWKENDSSAEGFIAHEVQEIFPDAIYGVKDGEKPQGMDYGRITPLLVKAIQEQQEIIQELKAEIETLKNK